MTTHTAIDWHSDESMREALLTLRREHDALTIAHTHSEHLLQALNALLDHNAGEAHDDACPRVFDALREVFTFQHALLMVETDNGTLECLMAQPGHLAGSRWPIDALFSKVMAGKTVTTLNNAHLIDLNGADKLGLDGDQSALYTPIRVRGGRGVMILLRSAEEEGFDRQHVHLARRFSVLASHALAARFASQEEAESRRLRQLSLKLRASERAAKRNADLLTKLVNVLPVGVIVQDHRGRTTIVNDAAAKAAGRPAHTLLGRLPFDEIEDPHARDLRQRQFARRLRSSTPATEEQRVAIDGDVRTLLRTQKSVHLLDEALLVTTTLDISDRKRIEDEMTYRAFHDQLTGLPNRALMEERVSHLLNTLPQGEAFALAFIDLDHFKQINDCYSHAVGDQLLVATARRIQQTIRSTDILARISGDEFLLLVYPLIDPKDLAPLMNRIANVLREPFRIEGYELMTSASIGASIYPAHGDSYETLRRTADSAMYLAKKSNKGGVSYFDPAMAESVAARMALEQRLRTAIHAGHFRAALQPKVMVDSGKTVGFEALVRWVEPDGKVNMPGLFIQMATDLGLIDDITRLVIGDVLTALPHLCRHFGDDVSVSVNIGARQAGQVAFMQALIDQIEASGTAKHLVLEITEDALLATKCFQQQVLPALRRIGLRVSIDDFGTGYSSLAMLADVIADEVKVDRAFITAIQDRPRSQGILRAIESLCNALGITMVAEGVETSQELTYLQQHTSIAQAQGYLFGKPAFLEHWVPEAASPSMHDDSLPRGNTTASQAPPDFRSSRLTGFDPGLLN